MTTKRQEIALYIQNAHEMLQASRVLLDNDFYSSAINRAYYAVFYAASALLVTKDISHGKHTGVISAFRQHFIKPGLIPSEYSKIYGRILEDRHESDYELDSSVNSEDARLNLSEAEQFVLEAEQWLKSEKWL